MQLLALQLRNTLLTGAAIAMALQPAFAFASPVGGVVSGGSAVIDTQGSITTITQSSGRAVIDWSSFDVGAQESVNFAQPNAGAITFNRINDSKASLIDGSINANGNVWFSNTHGMVFGSNAQVNVGGLIATTADMGNAAFMAGSSSFSIAGMPDAGITNHGMIKVADGGLAALVAPSVANSGVITARLGKVHLAGADTFTIDPYGDGLINLAVSDAVQSQIVSNSGAIIADGGVVRMTTSAASDTVNSLINLDGIITARTVGDKQGKIVLQAEGGTTVVSGGLDVSGTDAGETGGAVEVLGKYVVLQGATIDASGHAGGGDVKIGGDYQGGGSTTRADKTLVDANANIYANALSAGNGGRVIVWADDATGFYGNIEAKGGSISGNGGFIETSGKRFLDASGIVNTSAAWGATGTWLLDPTDITISSAADTGTMTWDGTNFSDTTAATSNLNVTTLQNRLATNNVIVTTASGLGGNGDITVVDPITWATGNSLTLFADRNIAVNAGITYTGASNTSLTLQANENIITSATIAASGAGKLDVTLNSDREANQSGYITAGGNIISNGGNIIMGGGSGAITSGSGFAWGNGATMYGISISHATLNAGGGNILLQGRTGVNGPPWGATLGIYLDTATVQTAGSGTLTFNGISSGNANSQGLSIADSTITGGSGDITLTGSASAGGIASLGINVGNTTIETTGAGSTGNITLNGTADNAPGNLSNGINLDSASLLTVNGNISVSGTDAGNSGNLYGIFLRSGTNTIKSTGSGTIAILGNAATAGIANIATLILGGNTGSGNITLSTDILSNSGTLSGQTTGTVILNSYNQNGTIGINGAAGTLQIDSTLLGQITASTLTIGRADGTGLLRVAGYNASARNWNLSLLNGTGNIQFDGVVSGSPSAWTMAANKFFSASNIGSTGNITSSAAGSIVTSGTGTINLWAGTDLNFANDFDLTTATGDVTLRANNSIIESGSGDITTNGGHIVLNSDRDASGAGAISLGSGSVLGSNGGNITLGGGADPSTTVAYGAAGVLNPNSGQSGIYLETATLNAGGGSISARGQGGSAVGGYNYGVDVRNSTLQTSSTGTISLTGLGGNTSDRNSGIYLTTSTLQTADGGITLHGTGNGGVGSLVNTGILTNAIIQATGLGAITLTGAGANTSGGYNNGITTGGTIQTVDGTINLTGTAGGGNAAHGIYTGGIIRATGSGNILLAGAGGANNGDFNNYLSTTQTATGNITITGSGSIGVYNYSNAIRTTSGTITLTASANASGALTIDGSTIGSGTQTGNINLVANGLTNLNSSTIQTAGTVTIAPYSQNGTIGVGGATGTLGITSALLNNITASTLTVGRADGTGLMRVAGYDASARNWSLSLLNGTGNIQFDGVVSGSPSAWTMAANKFFSASNIGSTGSITSSAAGSIVTSGTGYINLYAGTDLTFANDFDLTTATGDVTLRANNSIIESGSGDITTAGGAITLNSDRDASGVGAISLDSGTTLTSNGGNITLGGGANPATTAAYGTASNIQGIVLTGASVVAGGGNILMKGIGYNGTNTNHGIYLLGSNPTISTTGTGTIDLSGTGGGTGITNIGIYLASATSSVTSVNGDLSITGNGSATGTSSGYGVFVGGGSIKTTGTGNITVTATAAGTGNNAAGYESNIVNGIQATGTGNITVTGTGSQNAGAGSGLHGVNLVAGSIAASGGNVAVTGFGGAGTGGYGVHINGAASGISTTGNGTVTVNGTARGTGSTNMGVYLSNSTSGITSVNGDLTITGAGSTSAAGNSNYGVAVVGKIDTTGTGRLNITGTGGTGTSNNWGTIISNGQIGANNSGGITITGINGSNTTQGIYSDGTNTIGGASATGNISLIANNISFTTTMPIQTTGTVTIAPYSQNGTLGFSGGAGTLAVTQAMMNAINAPTVTIGRADATAGGTLTTGAYTWNSTLTNLNLYGYNTTLGAALTSGATSGTHDKNLTVKANNNVTQNTNVSSSSTYGKLNVVYNSDADASGAGEIDINSGTLASNGGNILFGGGANASDYAVGTNAPYPTGIYIGGAVNAGGGNITMRGKSFTVGGDSYGIQLTNTVQTSGTGMIDLIGLGNGTGLGGIRFYNGGHVNSTGSGAITLTGAGSGTGIVSSSGTNDIGGASYSGNITLIADSINLASFTPTIQTTGNVTIQPYTNSTTIGINGATGSLAVTSTVLGSITAGTLTLGRSDGTGLIRMAGYDASARNWSLSLLNGSANIQFDGVVGGSPSTWTMAANKFFSASNIGSTGSITSSAAGSIVTSGTGYINLYAGTDLNFANDFDLTTAIGDVTLRANNSIIESGSGDITTAGGAIILNSDRDASGAGAISLGSGTVLASNGGNITLGGGANPATTSAYGTAANRQGIYLNNAQLLSGAGNILMRGTGYSNNAAADLKGIYIYNNALVQSTSGSITAYGQGGSGNTAGSWYSNSGIDLDSGGRISSAQGAIALNGTGDLTGTANFSVGVDMTRGGKVESTGTGGSASTITINGIGGVNSLYGYGIVTDTGTITTVDGAVTLTGTGTSAGSATALNGGIVIGGLISSTGSGSLSLTGIAGNGGTDIRMYTGGISSTGDITLNGNSWTYSGASIQSSGNVTFAPRTASGTIGINGATGTLGITSALLNNITASTLTIGRADGTGLMRVGGYDASARNWNLSLLNGSGTIQFDGVVGGSPSAWTMAANKSFSTATTSGAVTTSATAGIITSGTGDITLDDPLTLGGNLTLTSARNIALGIVDGGYDLTTSADAFTLGGAWGGTTRLGAVSLTSASALTLPGIRASSLLARTTGATSDITLNGLLNASGAGNSLILTSGDDVINNGGASALSAGAGRFLIYSEDNGQDTRGGISGFTSVFQKTYAGYAPGAVTESGNVWLYRNVDSNPYVAPPAPANSNPIIPTSVLLPSTNFYAVNLNAPTISMPFYTDFSSTTVNVNNAAGASEGSLVLYSRTLQGDTRGNDTSIIIKRDTVAPQSKLSPSANLPDLLPEKRKKYAQHLSRLHLRSAAW